MIFLFHRWDMLVPRRVLNGMILQVRQPFHIYHVLICNHIMPIEVASCNAHSESPEANFCITSQTLQYPWQEGEIPDVRWGGHAAIREGAMVFFHRPTTGSKVHFRNLNLMNTPRKLNIAPEKWWLEDYFWEGNFSAAMLNFRSVWV